MKRRDLSFGALPNGKGAEHKRRKKDTRSTKTWYRSKLFVPFVASFVLLVVSSRSVYKSEFARESYGEHPLDFFYRP